MSGPSSETVKSSSITRSTLMMFREALGLYCENYTEKELNKYIKCREE